MIFFNDEDIDDEERKDIAFQLLNATREVINLGRNTSNPVSYASALGIIEDISPDLYNSFIKYFPNKNENDKVRLYKEIAEAQSTHDNIVYPLDLIEKEIIIYEELLKKSRKDKHIKNELIHLKAAKEYFMPRRLSETKILEHDTYLSGRELRLGKIIDKNTSFRDYKLPNNEILRVRLTHPDEYEKVLGTDMIYEQFDFKNNRVRFIHLQYKTWDEKRVLYIDERAETQMKKMEHSLCNKGLCNHLLPLDGKSNFRMPYCSAFLRPTDKQKPEAKMMSSGIHIPICYIMENLKNGNKVSKSNQYSSLSSQIFEELFHSNMIGSKWMSIDELEEFYESKNLHSLMNTIRVHAQQIKVYTDVEKNIGR